MNRISLVKKLGLLLAVALFASCDKEFNTIGSDIVGDDYLTLAKYESTDITAYDSLTGPVQTNNLALNSLGIYKNEAFGVSTSHFVTQVELTADNATINTNPEVDSVWVYVPYFSQEDGTNADGTRKFVLDSIHGGEQKFRLKVYENGYHIESYNPQNPAVTLPFYSNDKALVESNLRGVGPGGTSIPNGGQLNNSTSVAENDQFYFDSKERIIYKTDGLGYYVDATGERLEDQETLSVRIVKERFVPGIWLNLDKEYVKNVILKAGAQNLANNNVFKEYFKGLYFQVEAISPGQGALAQLDFTKGFVRITYNTDTATDTDNNPATPTPTRVKKTMTLALKGNTINFFDGNYAFPTFPQSDQRLHLKGGNGSFATIDLFGNTDANGNGVPDELDYLRDNKWLINEANLTFYIDQSSEGMGDVHIDQEPNRLYLYDTKTKEPIQDYYMDGSVVSSNTKYNKRFLGGVIEKEAGKGVKYKIRITEHIKTLLEDPTATNYKLSLCVTENINYFSNGYLKTPSGEQTTKVIPVASIINPLGTILYGANLPVTNNKRLKLEIYYTKPD